MAASVGSHGTPGSSYVFLTDSTGDPEENVRPLSLADAASYTAYSNPDLSLSPASFQGCMGPWDRVNFHSHQAQPQPSRSISPYTMDLIQQLALPTNNYGDTSTRPNITSVPAGDQAIPDGQTFVTSEQAISDWALTATLSEVAGDAYDYGFLDAPDPRNPPDFSSMGNIQMPLPSIEPHSLMLNELDIPQHYQSRPDDPSWNSMNLLRNREPHAGNYDMWMMEDSALVSPSPPVLQSSPVGTSTSASASPPCLKIEAGVGHFRRRERSARTSDPTKGPIRNKRGPPELQRKKAPHSAPRSSASSSGSHEFHVVTPDSVNANAGNSNPYEYPQGARPTQKGRKGPLSVETKNMALEVRRKGACFPCSARKVKCALGPDSCGNCRKMMLQIPQIVCWKFPDFNLVLFPKFIRSHFQKEEMTKFISENIAGFTVDGVEKPCEVELFSGLAWTNSTFKIRAKFFTAKAEDSEALVHYQLQICRNNVELKARRAPPIGLEMNTAQRGEITKKTKDYIASILQEPNYAEQVTDSLRHTLLPRRILKYVQRYAQQSKHPIVNKALSIYTMHYVMTRHLCLTKESIDALRYTQLVAQDNPWVTPRVLNRQIKSVIDEMLQAEMTKLFDIFSKTLKSKNSQDWAPCLAAFLVLCLFMEAVETASDTWVMSENEIDLRDNRTPQFKRQDILKSNNALENLPFKQFAHQFHQIYATHSKEPNAKSFNPLVDEACLKEAGLDREAYEMVLNLRYLIDDYESLGELNYLCGDPDLPNQESHPYPRDIAYNYTGRLVAKFLLSFKEERYIWGEC